MIWPMRKKAVSAQSLDDLLLSSVTALSDSEEGRGAGLRALAIALNARQADPERVRAIARDLLYSGSDNPEALAGSLMQLLSTYGYGESQTVQQPTVVRERSANICEQDEPPCLENQNLLLELASNTAYSGAIICDAGVGATTLLKALIGAWCKQAASKPMLVVADMRGGHSWNGLERIENTVLTLPPRDQKFIELAAQLFREVAQEIQSRVSQFSLSQKSSLGKRAFPPYLLVVDGISAIAEELNLFTNNQIKDHKHAGPLIRDFRYCLMSGPAVGVSVVVTGDRLDNLGLSKTAASHSRVIGLGAVREGGRGGYRALDNIVNSKDYIPEQRERSRLRVLLSEAKRHKQPVALSLSGIPRIGGLNDFRDDRLDLGELYRYARAGL